MRCYIDQRPKTTNSYSAVVRARALAKVALFRCVHYMIAYYISSEFIRILKNELLRGLIDYPIFFCEFGRKPLP